MAKKIVNLIIGSLGSIIAIPFMKELIVFWISMSPILELRGGLIASALLKLNPLLSYILCVVGNIIPIPFILIFISRILKWMRKSKKFKKIASWLDKKVEKNRTKIEKYGYLGLVLFVAIPLPGTGAWTGCLVAGVLEMDRKKSFIATTLGVLIASIIMMIVSFGLLSNIV